MLLEAGAEVDDCDDSDNPDFPWTALASSCLLAHAQLMTQLLRYGADPSLRCNGMLPSELLGLGLPPAQRKSEELERMTCVLSTALSRGRAEAVQFAVRLEQVVVQQKFRQEEAASDALVTAAAVAKYGRAALHFSAKPPIVLDCFKPAVATPAYILESWSRRSSAETKCVSYEGAGCLLSQVLADEPADDERFVVDLSAIARPADAGGDSEQLALNVAVGRSLVAPTTLLEAPQTPSGPTGKRVIGAAAIASSTATATTGIRGGTPAVTGAYSAPDELFKLPHGYSSSSYCSSSSSSIADGNSYCCLEQCPLCGEKHLDSSAAHTSQCWSSDLDPFEMYSDDDSGAQQQQQSQQHTHANSAIGSVAKAVRANASSSTNASIGHIYAMRAQHHHSAVGTTAAAAAAAATTAGAATAAATTATCASGGTAAPYYTADSKLAGKALLPRTVLLQQWQQYVAIADDSVDGSCDDKPMISCGVQPTTRLRGFRRPGTPHCRSGRVHLYDGFNSLSDTNSDHDDQLLRLPTRANEWPVSVERQPGNCVDVPLVAAEQRCAVGMVLQLSGALTDTSSVTSQLEEPPCAELLIPDTLQQLPQDSTDVTVQIRDKLQWLLECIGSDSAAAVCTDTVSEQCTRELQQQVSTMSSAIRHLKQQIQQAPQYMRTAVAFAQAERDAVVQQHATVLAALRDAEQAKRELVHKDIEHSSGVVRLKLALSAAAANTERLQEQCSVLQARINELQQANDDLQQCSSTVEAERNALKIDVQQLSAQASEHVQHEQELLATIARQDTLIKVAKADTEKWLQDSVRRTREAQHQREVAAAAQKELAVAMQQKQHAQVKIDVMHATQRRLYDSLALRAARRCRGVRSTREDIVSDVRDRAAFAVLSTMLVFDSSDAIQAIAAAE
jgi:hypothetical protein